MGPVDWPRSGQSIGYGTGGKGPRVIRPREAGPEGASRTRPAVPSRAGPAPTSPRPEGPWARRSRLGSGPNIRLARALRRRRRRALASRGRGRMPPKEAFDREGGSSEGGRSPPSDGGSGGRSPPGPKAGGGGGYAPSRGELLRSNKRGGAPRRRREKPSKLGWEVLLSGSDSLKLTIMIIFGRPNIRKY